MKFKIINIKGCKTCKQVFIGFARDSEGIDYLEICAWHKVDDEEYYQIEEIKSENQTLLERIFHDFSECSANELANSFNC